MTENQTNQNKQEKPIFFSKQTFDQAFGLLFPKSIPNEKGCRVTLLGLVSGEGNCGSSIDMAPRLRAEESLLASAKTKGATHVFDVKYETPANEHRFYVLAYGDAYRIEHVEEKTGEEQ
jgi:hypothetical protein